MTKPQPKPVLVGFNWAESLKKAEQEGTSQKIESAPSGLGSHDKASIKPGSVKQKQVGSKSQQRLRVKV